MNREENNMKNGTGFNTAIAVLVGGVLLSGCGRANDRVEAGNAFRPTDDEITGAIEDELGSRDTSMKDVHLSTENGIVTLNGDVSSLLTEQEALRIARSTRGVRAVVDDMAVVPERRSDAEIEADVKRALDADAATRSYGLGVTVQGGVVSLTGTVKSWGERWLASDAVRNIKGVAGIEDHTVVTGVSRSDDQIKADVTGRLRSDAWIDNRMLDVGVQDGKVILSGEVGSAEEKARATDDALMVGATDVDASGLSVEWSVDSDMEREGSVAQFSDESVRKAVMDAAAVDPRVDPKGVEVAVDSDVVTLSGTVPYLQARLALVEDATNTLGVLGVVDSVTVRGTGAATADTAVETLVQQALQRDPYVSRYDVGVDVKDGVVSLTGTVRQRYEKNRVRRIVEKLNGVTAVNDDIEVDTDAAPMTDQQILTAIERKLHWNPWMADADINVEVEDGVAVIRGTVHGWFERNLVQDMAKEAGARGVLTELDVVLQHAAAASSQQ
jgi:osmotically-inducible protein OsmY